MKFKLVIRLAALAALCVAPFGRAHAQKNKKGNTVSQQLTQQESATTPMLQPGQTNFYVTIRGVKQGIFKGQTPTAGHQGEIMGFKYLFQLSSPVTASSGMASGRHQYTPITFTKLLDASSPQVIQGCLIERGAVASRI